MSAYIKHMVDTCTDKEGVVDLNVLFMRYLRGTGKTLISFNLEFKPILDYIRQNKLSSRFIAVSEMDMKERIIGTIKNKQ